MPASDPTALPRRPAQPRPPVEAPRTTQARQAPGRKGAPSPGSAFALLAQARLVLAEAERTADVGERFRLAHLAALRVAAAVLAHRGRPAAARRRLMSVWVVLDAVAPEYSDWGRYFAAGAPVRAAVEAGALHAVSPRDADDQVRSADTFLRLVEGAVGLLAAPLAS